MFDYVGYGLHIRSELHLPGFTTGKHEALPEVRILRRRKPPQGWPIRNDNGKRLTGVADNVMRFLVRDGIEIVVDIQRNADLDFARAIVSGELMSALLRQRGLLTLHASCVAKSGEAIGFVGHSGWGKSTLAMQYVEQEYQLICDDVLAIECTPEGPVAVPGYPQVKLRNDCGSRFARGFEHLPAAHSETDKRLLVTDRFQNLSVPLRRLYLLEGRNRNVTRVVDLEDQEAVIALSMHTRATNLLKNAAFRRSHLQQVTALVSSVPVKLLQRRLSLDGLPDVQAAIEQDRKENRAHEPNTVTTSTIPSLL